MQVKSIAECSKFGEHSAKLSTLIKLPFANKIFVLSIVWWAFYTGFTVQACRQTDRQTDRQTEFTARDCTALGTLVRGSNQLSYMYLNSRL